MARLLCRITFKGDNAPKETGEFKRFQAKHVFAWEASERGAEVNVQGEPTRLELMQKTFTVKKEDFQSSQNASILAKVRLCHLRRPPPPLPYCRILLKLSTLSSHLPN